MTAGLAVQGNLVILNDHICLWVLVLLAEHELINEPIKVVLELRGVVGAVDDPTVIRGLGVGLGTIFLYLDEIPMLQVIDSRDVSGPIEAESNLQFTRIAFEELVRACLGYNVPSIEWVLLQHTVLYIHLLNNLQIYPEEIPLYSEVEKVRSPRSPSFEVLYPV